MRQGHNSVALQTVPWMYWRMDPDPSHVFLSLSARFFLCVLIKGRCQHGIIMELDRADMRWIGQGVHNSSCFPFFRMKGDVQGDLTNLE